MEANRAAFGYTKVALLFFVSLLVTWVLNTPPKPHPFDLPVKRSKKTTPAYVTIGPLLHQPSLSARLPLECLPPIQLRRGHRPPLDGFLEFLNLHHHFMGRRAFIIQRQSERKQRVREEELRGLPQRPEFEREDVDGGGQ